MLSVFYRHSWGGDKDLKASAFGKQVGNELEMSSSDTSSVSLVTQRYFKMIFDT